LRFAPCSAIIALMADDLQLFELWQRGDRSAGNSLFGRHFKGLYRFFANKVQDDIDELIQETFLACVSSRDRFRKKSSFRTYLFTIARNELYTYLQRRKRSQDLLDFGVTSLMDMGISPTGRFDHNHRNNLLLQALRSLPLEQQVLLELYYWEEMSTAELAETLDIAIDAVKARLFRARNTLRKNLKNLAGDTGFQYQELNDLDSWARAIKTRDRERPADEPA
jgi:RNA polymerase sigma factor (sigma-70 family)